MEGIVLQTYGAGNCPDDRRDIIAEIQAAADRGMIILNCTQCSSGGVSASYQTGKVSRETLQELDSQTFLHFMRGTQTQIYVLVFAWELFSVSGQSVWRKVKMI